MGRYGKIALVIVVLLSSAPARAHEPGFVQGWHLPAGLVLGGAATEPRGFLIGGELSVNYLDTEGKVLPSWGWLGGYVDLVRASKAERTRLSVGPQLGMYFFGLDGGYVAQWSEAGVQHGVVGRFLLSYFVVHAYVRVGRLFGAAPVTFVEAGGMLKIPFLALFRM